MVKEMLITHEYEGMANVVVVNDIDYRMQVKRVPSNSPELAYLKDRRMLTVCRSELGPTADIWLARSTSRGGWVYVAVDGRTGNTIVDNRLDSDEFLSAFIELPSWSDKSKSFVAKLLTMGQQVCLRDKIKAVGVLPSDVDRAFKNMLLRLPKAPESAFEANRLEMWALTLERLYGSDMSLLDVSLLSTLTWQKPRVLGDVVHWKSVVTGFGVEILNIFVKGSDVLYVGYDTISEVGKNRHTLSDDLWRGDSVLSYETLLTPSCAGLLDVGGEPLHLMTYGAVRVCNESLQIEETDLVTRYLTESMVLLDVSYVEMPFQYTIMTSSYYDVVYDKVHLFKNHNSGNIGMYYGSMSVEAWLEQQKSSEVTR